MGFNDSCPAAFFRTKHDFADLYLRQPPYCVKRHRDIDASYPELQALIANMYETLKESDSIGLAAPQIGLDIRLCDYRPRRTQRGFARIQGLSSRIHQSFHPRV